MDLMGPMKVENLDGKKYAFVYVDDFWWYTWVKLFREKYDTFKVCMLCSMSTIRREQKKKTDCRIHSDHDREFKKPTFSEFCCIKGIVDEFLAPLNIMVLLNERI